MIADWIPPSSLAEAYGRKLRLVAEIEEINAQLGDRLKRTKAEMDYEEYQEWRTKAIWASTNRLQELRLVKQWITENKSEQCLPAQTH